MLKYEQHKQKPPQQSAYSPIYGQHRKHPQFNALLEKTPRKVAEVAVEVTEVTMEVEAETPLQEQVT